MFHVGQESTFGLAVWQKQVVSLN